MTMTELVRPDPFFIADHHALDFLNSVGAPWGKEIEWINSGQDLLNWLKKSGLISEDVARKFDTTDEKELTHVANQARELRDWFRDFIVKHAGHPLDPSALIELEVLNRILAKDSTYFQIEVDNGDSSLKIANKRRWSTAEALLFPLAKIMGELICNIEFVRIKNCEGSTCTMWFNDVSKNHTRRWCSMAICGNRVKAAAHRAKKKLAK